MMLIQELQRSSDVARRHSGFPPPSYPLPHYITFFWGEILKLALHCEGLVRGGACARQNRKIPLMLRAVPGQNDKCTLSSTFLPHSPAFFPPVCQSACETTLSSNAETRPGLAGDDSHRCVLYPHRLACFFPPHLLLV